MLLEKQRPEQPLRGRRVMVAEVEPEEPAEDPAYKELKHWTAQGLNKFGYSKDEARRMAESVPPGLDLQHACNTACVTKGASNDNDAVGSWRGGTGCRAAVVGEPPRAAQLRWRPVMAARKPQQPAITVKLAVDAGNRPVAWYVRVNGNLMERGKCPADDNGRRMAMRYRDALLAHWKAWVRNPRRMESSRWDYAQVEA